MLCVRLEASSRTLSHVKGETRGLMYEKVWLDQGLASWKFGTAPKCHVAFAEGLWCGVVPVPLS